MKQISGLGVKSWIIWQSYTCRTSTIADVIGQAWHKSVKILIMAKALLPHNALDGKVFKIIQAIVIREEIIKAGVARN